MSKLMCGSVPSLHRETTDSLICRIGTPYTVTATYHMINWRYACIFSIPLELDVPFRTTTHERIHVYSHCQGLTCTIVTMMANKRHWYLRVVKTTTITNKTELPQKSVFTACTVSLMVCVCTCKINCTIKK